MKRVLVGLLVLVVAALVIPPLWYAVFPVELETLPPPGRAVEVVPGLSVNVIERGSGPPVVLVHGHPGCAYDWDPTTELLADRYRVIAYDRVGYGYSDGREVAQASVEDNARELLGLLEALELRDATVVGWSYGGGTAIAAARSDASRIGRIVLVGSVGPGIESGDRGGAAFTRLIGPWILRWAAMVPPVEASIQRTLLAEAFHPDPITEPALRQLAANFARPHTLDAFLSEGRDLGEKGPGEGPIAPIDPAPLELPILIVQGDEDRLVPLAVAETLHDRAQQSELLVLSEAGHIPPVTHAQLLADSIDEFVRKHSGPSWSLAGGRVVEKVAASKTAGAYSVVTVDVPGGSETPAHVHSREDLLVFVADGSFEIRVGEQSFPSTKGAVAVLPRDVPHSLHNRGESLGRLMVTIFPAGMETLLERLAATSGDATSGAGEPSDEAVQALMESYGVTPVLADAPSQ